MRLRIGTSGFSYAAWRGRFYPARFPPSQMLDFYSHRFDTVEINNTFYRPPGPEQLAGWFEQVPPGFRFALKAPRRITHEKRIAGAERELGSFLESAAELGRRLGPILFQLPPNLPLDLVRFDAFLAALPDGLDAAFEFRHPSWLVEAVYARLGEHGKALCVAETDAGVTPLLATAPLGYVRLRKSEYAPRELAHWAERLQQVGWVEAYVFFMHEDEARGPLYAEQLRAFAEGREPAAPVGP